MIFGFGYSEEKSLFLKETRKVSFEDIIRAIKTGGLLTEIKHPNSKKYPNQRIMVVRIENYIYSVPFVLDIKRKIKFLKTLWPSRVLTKKYLKK